jgi:hypothetical protein
MVEEKGKELKKHDLVMVSHRRDGDVSPRRIPPLYGRMNLWEKSHAPRPHGVYWGGSEWLTPVHFNSFRQYHLAVSHDCILPIYVAEDTSKGGLIMEMPRFEYQMEHRSGGWCNIRLYATDHEIPHTWRNHGDLVIPKNAVTEAEIQDIYAWQFPPHLSLVCVMSEPIKEDGDYANVGLSVINAAEIIANQVSPIIHYLFNHNVHYWIEHSPERGNKKYGDSLEEDFSHLKFTKRQHLVETWVYDDPVFRPTSREVLETIGIIFDPITIPSNDVNESDCYAD